MLKAKITNYNQLFLNTCCLIRIFYIGYSDIILVVSKYDLCKLCKYWFLPYINGFKFFPFAPNGKQLVIRQRIKPLVLSYVYGKTVITCLGAQIQTKLRQKINAESRIIDVTREKQRGIIKLWMFMFTKTYNNRSKSVALRYLFVVFFFCFFVFSQKVTQY